MASTPSWSQRAAALTRRWRAGWESSFTPPATHVTLLRPTGSSVAGIQRILLVSMMCAAAFLVHFRNVHNAVSSASSCSHYVCFLACLLIDGDWTTVLPPPRKYNVQYFFHHNMPLFLSFFFLQRPRHWADAQEKRLALKGMIANQQLRQGL